MLSLKHVEHSIFLKRNQFKLKESAYLTMVNPHCDEVLIMWSWCSPNTVPKLKHIGFIIKGLCLNESCNFPGQFLMLILTSYLGTSLLCWHTNFISPQSIAAWPINTISFQYKLLYIFHLMMYLFKPNVYQTVSWVRSSRKSLVKAFS